MMMHECVRHFETLTPDLQSLAGGKGAVLARLYQSGYPVPQGFVVLTTAFDEDGLVAHAWQQVAQALAALRGAGADVRFAVRSSSVGEDAARTSFAGEFETVLDVKDEEVREAINTVYRSRLGARVRAYSEAHGLDDEQPMAVVVQHMVPAALAGVLFTADPVTGSTGTWSGNICGKVYSNISRRVAMISAITGMTRERILNQLFGDLFGQIPEGLQVPDHGFTRWGALKEVLPNILRVLSKTVL